MESYIEKLKALDPSDNMDTTIDAIMKVIEYARSHRGTDQFKEALSLISDKEEEVREYYLRPLDNDHLYHSLIELHSEISDNEGVKRYNRCLDIRQSRKWTILGDCYALMGMNKRAVTHLKRALFFGPTEDLLEEVKSTLEKAERRVIKAENDLSKVRSQAEKNGFDPRSSSKLLSILLDLDIIEEMDLVLKKVLKTNKDDQELLYRKGSYLFAKGDFKQALKIFEALHEENPKSNNYKRAVNMTEEFLNKVI